MKVLSIDPGLRKTGFAVLERKDDQNSIKALTFGIVKSPTKLSQSECLVNINGELNDVCLLYTSPSPRDRTRSRMPSSA